MKLEEALQECTLALLRRIAAAHGLAAGEEALRVELARRIAERLVEPGHLATYLESLPRDEVGVLQAVRDQGWAAKAFVLERGPRRSGEGAAPAGGATSSPGLSLLQKGLLFRTFAAMGSWRGEVYHVPEELRDAVSTLLPPESAPWKPDVRAPAEPEVAEQRDAALDLFRLLSFLRGGNRRTARDTLSRADLARLRAEAGPLEPEGAGDRDERWRFLLHLCLAGGWVRREGELLKPGRGAVGLLSGRRTGVRARLLDRYLRDRSWSDLAAAGKVRQALGSRQVNEAAGRRLLVHHLGDLAGEGWADEGAFMRAVKLLDPDFLREDYASPAWGLVDAVSGIELYGSGCWEAVEGEWIRYVLRGPLRWLGVVRWGRLPGGGMPAFQYRGETGGEVGPAEAGASPGLSLGGDLALPVGEEGDLGVLYRLEPYLEANPVASPTSYRVTRESVLRGLEGGGSWEELRSLLEGLAPEPERARILAEVGAWAATYGRLVLEPAVLLVAASAEEAEAAAGLSGVVPCLQTRLGSRAFRVVPERLWELVRHLRAAGHLPRVDPRARLPGARSAAADAALLRESLFALRVLRALHPDLLSEAAAEAVRRIEAVLDPDEVGEITGRADRAVRRLQGREGASSDRVRPA